MVKQIIVGLLLLFMASAGYAAQCDTAPFQNQPFYGGLFQEPILELKDDRGFILCTYGQDCVEAGELTHNHNCAVRVTQSDCLDQHWANPGWPSNLCQEGPCSFICRSPRL